MPDPYKGFPLRGKLSPQATDEGRVHGSFPLTGTRRKAAPHPASVGASATFPQRGKAVIPKIRAAFLPASPLHGLYG